MFQNGEKGAGGGVLDPCLWVTRKQTLKQGNAPGGMFRGSAEVSKSFDNIMKKAITRNANL